MTPAEEDAIVLQSINGAKSRGEVDGVEAIRLAIRAARDAAIERAQRAEALAESYKALLIEAQRECHEDNGLMARIDAAIAGSPPSQEAK